MLTLELLKTADSASASTSEQASFDVKIASISGPIKGKFGTFRVVTLANGNKYNLDDAKIENRALFTMNCNAVLTINQYKNAEGEEKTVISSLSISVEKGSGYFVMH